MFYCRENELAKLNKRYEGGQFECVVIYGRRRVGKTALIYGITDGVPHYINKLGVQDDLDEALLENLFDPSDYLFEEPENLLKQELREPGVYNSIITSIAEGASKLNEIATKTQISTGPCSKYLKVLTELGIIRKDLPVSITDIGQWRGIEAYRRYG